MADVITRLKVDSSEYDSKIKRATQGLLSLETSLHKIGKSFADADAEQVEFARQLGHMETVSKSVKGKLNELTQSYTELAMQYKNITDEEKNSPFGKALSASLDQLKGRIQQTKKDLDETTKSLNDNDVAVKRNSSDSETYGNILQGLASKFGVSVSALTGWGAALGAATVVLKVMKDAFFNNEQYLDEWGRTVESVESVYNGFLNSLNTGDVNGFLVNIQTITQAARDAYDALDELATFNAFNKANIAGARADLSGAIADYRENKGSKESVQKASDELIKELETRQQLQAEAYKKVVAEVARQRQVNPEDLLEVMTGQWGSFKELKDLEYTGQKSRLINTGGTYASGPQFKTITEAVPANDRERLAQAVKHLNDTEIESLQSLAEAAKMTQVEINNQRKMVARVLNGRQGGTAGGGGGTTKTGGAAASWSAVEMREVGMVSLGRSVKDVNADLAGAQKDYTMAGDEFGRAAALKMIETYKKELEGIKNEGNPFKDANEHDFGKDIEKLNKELVKNDKEKNLSGMEMAKGFGQMLGGIQQMVGGLEQIGIELPKGFSQMLSGMQGIITILEAIKTIQTVGSFLGIFNRGGVVKAASGWGGVVPGNHLSGDMVPALLNSQELVLNSAQAGNLASQLRGNGGGGYVGVPYVDCEKVILGVNNVYGRRGQGEIVTTGMLKKMGVI